MTPLSGRPNQECRLPHGNVVLIGMAGVGKSTVGILLARAAGKDFLDIDILIQRGEGDRLQSILDAKGGDAFLAIEEKYVNRLDPSDCVISTGGSVVHSPGAMAHLKALGPIVLLEAPVEILKSRVYNSNPRGLVMHGADSFEDLYEQRKPLYRQYADLVVDCNGLSQDQVVDAVLDSLQIAR